MDKRFFGILAALGLLFVGIAVFSGSDSKSTNVAAQPTNHVQGQGQKGVTLVEYGDYQCPVCLAYYLPLKQVAAQFSSDIYFQFRNLPIIGAHPNAFAAARAAEAADLQNKFWEMHSKLYENQNSWAPLTNPLEVFTKYGREIGLNEEKFKSDYASSAVNNRINADLEAFKKTGKRQATPTFFVNGEYVANSEFSDAQTGAPSVDKFAQVINDAIAKKQQ